MITFGDFKKLFSANSTGRWLLLLSLLLTTLLYYPGLTGDFIFDDYPNIVDNSALHPHDASFSSLLNAALSSPATEFKRPLASLSFALNYLATGLDPYWMKLTNLAIHLFNGCLVYLLTRLLLFATLNESEYDARTTVAMSRASIDVPAAMIAASWMILPINLTAVLYAVQRMESMANLFALIGLIGYVFGRLRMLGQTATFSRQSTAHALQEARASPFLLCVGSITLPVLIGLLAKETVVLLPLYAFTIEWVLFQFKTQSNTRDRSLLGLFCLVLFIPAIFGTCWLLPHSLNPNNWQTRSFTLEGRLLTELRVVVDYLRWTLLPTSHALSFYHDDFQVSTSLLTPWTTFGSMLLLISMASGAFWLRKRAPLVSLGVLLFLGAQLLTATIIPLELVYEHRNYFASFGLLLALIPVLAVHRDRPLALARWILLAGLTLSWCSLTLMTAYSWGNPLRLAEQLATRAPFSPRAQYELGRTYIIYSHYDRSSPFTRLAYAPLEAAARLPGSSILPEQALIFMNARMGLPLKDQWWQSMITKLKTRPVGVQDESALGTLTQCMRDGHCDLPREQMLDAYLAAINNHSPSARLLAMYADFAWNILEDRRLGLQLAYQTVKVAPSEPTYRITLARMLIASGRIADANKQISALEALNIGGRLNANIIELERDTLFNQHDVEPR
jgi:hypothetical protein